MLVRHACPPPNDTYTLDGTRETQFDDLVGGAGSVGTTEQGYRMGLGNSQRYLHGKNGDVHDDLRRKGYGIDTLTGTLCRHL